MPLYYFTTSVNPPQAGSGGFCQKNFSHTSAFISIPSPLTGDCARGAKEGAKGRKKEISFSFAAKLQKGEGEKKSKIKDQISKIGNSHLSTYCLSVLRTSPPTPFLNFDLSFCILHFFYAPPAYGWPFYHQHYTLTSTVFLPPPSSSLPPGEGGLRGLLYQVVLFFPSLFISSPSPLTGLVLDEVQGEDKGEGDTKVKD